MEIQPIGYEDLSISTTATGFTSATYSGADHAMVLVEDGSVRFRMSGTPTATVGDLLRAGDRIELNGASELAGVKFISKDGNTVTLRCSYGKSR